MDEQDIEKTGGTQDGDEQTDGLEQFDDRDDDDEQEGGQDDDDEQEGGQDDDDEQEGGQDDDDEQDGEHVRPSAPRRRHLGALGVALLVATAGAGFLLWVALHAYNVLSDAPPEGMARYYLPGIRIDLPAWEVTRDWSGRVPGAVSLQASDGRDTVRLDWCQGFELHSWDYSDHLVEQDMEIHGTHLALAAGEGVTIWQLRTAEAVEVLAVSWLCRRPYVRYFLRVGMQTSPELLLALMKRILSSVRCDTGTLAGVEVDRLPVMQDEGSCSWDYSWTGVRYGVCTGKGLLVLRMGWPGRYTPEQAAKMVADRMTWALDELPEATLIASQIRGTHPRRPTVHRTLGIDTEGSLLRVLWRLFHCDDVDQTFLATYAGPPDEDDWPHIERLQGLLCPSRLPAPMLLEEPLPPLK